MSPRTPASRSEKRAWSDLAHMAFLDALMHASPFEPQQFAFQGGTSLRLAWRSPRFSEDLDFLVAKDEPHAALLKAIPAIRQRMQRMFAAQDPGLSVEFKDKTKDGSRLIVFEISVSHPEKLGKAKVKTEFWCVPAAYLEQYKTALRYPAWRDDDIVARIESAYPVPTGTLESILADKLVAIAYRERVKWRDLFDIWWLTQQVGPSQPGFTDTGLTRRAVQHAQAYDGPGLEAGLSDFLDKRDALLAGEGCDLDRWLPPGLAQVLLPDKVPEIVEQSLELAQRALHCLETGAVADDQDAPDASSADGAPSL